MKKYLLVFLASLLVSFVIGMPPRGYLGFVYSSMIETPCYAVLTYFILKKFSKTNKEILGIAGLIILGRIIVEIPLRIVDWESTLISLPCTLLACLTIILTAFVFYTKKTYVCILALAIWGYCVFFGHKALLQYMIWGPTPKAQVGALMIRTSNGVTALESIKSEYIMLDFWIPQCGVCYKKFPDFQSFYNKSKDKLTIASVFVTLYKGEQESEGKAIIEKRGYTFPVWSVAKQDTLLKVLKIDQYPTIILLDKNRNVIFRGSLENAEKKLGTIIN